MNYKYAQYNAKLRKYAMLHKPTYCPKLPRNLGWGRGPKNPDLGGKAQMW